MDCIRSPTSDSPQASHPARSASEPWTRRRCVSRPDRSRAIRHSEEHSHPSGLAGDFNSNSLACVVAEEESVMLTAEGICIDQIRSGSDDSTEVTTAEIGSLILREPMTAPGRHHSVCRRPPGVWGAGLPIRRGGTPSEVRRRSRRIGLRARPHRQHAAGRLTLRRATHDQIRPSRRWPRRQTRPVRHSRVAPRMLVVATSGPGIPRWG